MTQGQSLRRPQTTAAAAGPGHPHPQPATAEAHLGWQAPFVKKSAKRAVHFHAANKRLTFNALRNRAVWQCKTAGFSLQNGTYWLAKRRLSHRKKATPNNRGLFCKQITSHIFAHPTTTPSPAQCLTPERAYGKCNRKEQAGKQDRKHPKNSKK